MNTVSDRNFGILIAYLVPGFTTLWGASYFSETIHEWLTGAAGDGPTVFAGEIPPRAPSRTLFLCRNLAWQLRYVDDA